MSSIYIEDVRDEDGEWIASFIDRLEAAAFAKALPWWHGRCRIARNLSRLPPPPARPLYWWVIVDPVL